MRSSSDADSGWSVPARSWARRSAVSPNWPADATISATADARAGDSTAAVRRRPRRCLGMPSPCATSSGAHARSRSTISRSRPPPASSRLATRSMADSASSGSTRSVISKNASAGGDTCSASTIQRRPGNSQRSSRQRPKSSTSTVASRRPSRMIVASPSPSPSRVRLAGRPTSGTTRLTPVSCSDWYASSRRLLRRLLACGGRPPLQRHGPVVGVHAHPGPCSPPEPKPRVRPRPPARTGAGGAGW